MSPGSLMRPYSFQHNNENDKRIPLGLIISYDDEQTTILWNNVIGNEQYIIPNKMRMANISKLASTLALQRRVWTWKDES